MKEEDEAIDELGNSVVGSRSHGFHGSNLYDFPAVLASGLPDDKGKNLNLPEHVAGASDSAFRGMTPILVGSPSGIKGACEHASEGGLVFEIFGVLGWNLELLASKACKIHKPEGEIAIFRKVPVAAIKRIASVGEKGRGRAKRLQAIDWRSVK